MKYCARCAEIKPVTDFGRNRADPSGLATYCRPCHNKAMAEIKAKKHGSVRGYHLERRYGLTDGEVAALHDRQGGHCLICLRRRALHVDHDHVSGDTRGLICFRCNGGLGQFKDDPEVIRAAVDYLEGRLGERIKRRADGFVRAPRGGRRSRRHYRLMARYGIGEEDVDRLVERQGGRCPICRKADALAVDHDHVTLEVRGVLCGRCNTGMGQLRDDHWVLRRAIEYLTGGLMGLRRGEDGRLAVTVVRPRRGGPVVDPGWDVGQIGGHDLAVLDAFARDDSGDPWEFDASDASASEFHFPEFDPALDRTDPRDDVPGPAAPPDPAEYAFF
jgi:hypothetical protein